MTHGEHEKAAKTEHTPEPWRVGRRGNNVIGSNGLGDTVAMMVDCDSDEQTHANARRIVACVNACAGLPTEFVEQFDVAGAFQTVHDLEKQRDELLAALKWIGVFGFDAPELRARARMAIASVKEVS